MFELPTVQPDPLTVGAWIYGYAVVRYRHQRRATLGTVMLGHSAYALTFLLGSQTFLCRQGLFTTLDLHSGAIFCLLLRRFHGHAVSSGHATQSPPHLALSVQHQDGTWVTGQTVGLTSSAALAAAVPLQRAGR